MDEQEVQTWTSQKLIKTIYHELNQKSAIALSLAIMLSDESTYGFVNDEQKKFLVQLREEIESIRQITDSMRIWLSANMDRSP